MGLPCGSEGKKSACKVGDLGWIPGSGRSPGEGKGYFGEGNGNPFQYSCLENPMNKGAWQATVHGVAKVGHDSVILFHQDPISLALSTMPWEALKLLPSSR